MVRNFLAFLLLAPSAWAQFIGYTLPQTTQQTVFQGRTTPGQSSPVRNIGQSVHLATYTTTGTINILDLRLEGSYNGTTWLQISEEATTPTQGGVAAFGYFPFVRVNLAALSGTAPAVTVSYTGTVTPFSAAGDFRNSLTIKTLGLNQPANTSTTFSISVSGNQGGVILFRYNAVTCAGSTLAVTAIMTGQPVLTVLPAATLAANTTTQMFLLPSLPGISLTFTYTTGCGGSAAAYDLVYGLSNVIQLIGTLNASGLPVAAGVGASALQVQGTVASGAAPANNPFLIAGVVSQIGTFFQSQWNSAIMGRQVSAANSPNTVLFVIANVHDTLAIHAVCSAGTATLTVEASGDLGANYLTIDSLAAAATQIKQYTATTVGATTALSPLAFTVIQITVGTCGVGNTSTLTIGGK